MRVKIKTIKIRFNTEDCLHNLLASPLPIALETPEIDFIKIFNTKIPNFE